MPPPPPLYLSGIQPSGIPHIGNYLGAIKLWSQPASHTTLLSIMDLHALTSTKSPRQLHADTLSGFASLLACRVTPTPTRHLFLQSRVPQHTELAWYLTCLAPVSLLERMTQYKDKSSSVSPNLGLLAYPVLMAADILLYRATHVPVGHDQLQHIELTRELAQLFNRTFHFDLVLPQSVIRHDTCRVMSLSNPLKKMSKSDPDPDSRVLLTDSPESIARKIRKAQTDSLGALSLGPELESRAGMANLVRILEAAGGRAVEGWTAKQLKDATTAALVAEMAPIRDEIHRLEKDPGHLTEIVIQGSHVATELAQAHMERIRRAVGVR